VVPSKAPALLGMEWSKTTGLVEDERKKSQQLSGAEWGKTLQNFATHPLWVGLPFFGGALIYVLYGILVVLEIH